MCLLQFDGGLNVSIAPNCVCVSDGVFTVFQLQAGQVGDLRGHRNKRDAGIWEGVLGGQRSHVSA